MRYDAVRASGSQDRSNALLRTSSAQKGCRQVVEPTQRRANQSLATARRARDHGWAADCEHQIVAHKPALRTTGSILGQYVLNKVAVIVWLCIAMAVLFAGCVGLALLSTRQTA